MRPWVFLLANERGLRGTVCNGGAGVRILVAGEQARVDDFVRCLRHAPPPLPRIDRIERAPGSERPAREVVARLKTKGLTIHSPARIPANGGGLSLGQALVAAAQTMPP